METVEFKIRQFPQNLQQEVEDFVDFLLEKKVPKKNKRATLNWLGDLKNLEINIQHLIYKRKGIIIDIMCVKIRRHHVI